MIRKTGTPTNIFKTLILFALIAGISTAAAAGVISGDASLLRFDVRMEKEIYAPDETVVFDVVALNGSRGEAIKLEFPSPLQIDYIIDGEYRYSELRLFPTVMTEVSIPTGGIHEWRIEHSSADYPIKPGDHIVRVELVGTGLAAEKKFIVESGGVTEVDPGVATGLRLNVRPEKEIYGTEETVVFDVLAVNGTSEDIRLEFPSSLQVDYVIDDRYRFSATRDFADVITEVTIPAGKGHNWLLEHNNEEYELQRGGHYVRVELVGTGLIAESKFIVTVLDKDLPEGIRLDLALSKSEYDPGEAIEFTLTATNTTGSDITLSINDWTPMEYYIVQSRQDTVVHDYDDTYEYDIPPEDTVVHVVSDETSSRAGDETTDVTIAAGGTATWDGVMDENRVLFAGSYSITAGLNGYTGEVSAEFTVTDTPVYCTVSGHVYTLSKTTYTLLPVSGATVTMYSSDPNIRTFAPVDPKDSEYYEVVTTGDDGIFRFENVPMGYYFFTTEKEGYITDSQWLRVDNLDTMTDSIIKSREDIVEIPLNYVKREIDGLGITISTNTFVYSPEGRMKGSLIIANMGDESVTFQFQPGEPVVWTLENGDGAEVWRSTEAFYDSTISTYEDILNGTLELLPGERQQFICHYSIADMTGAVGEGDYKYQFAGHLDFTSCTRENLSPDDVGGSVWIAVANSEISEVRTGSNTDVCVVDLAETRSAVIDMKMNDDGVYGDMNVTELRENIHNDLDDHTFIKMIEIDADETIREGMDNAVVRIYYDAEEVNNPENLRIAHWKTNMRSAEDYLDSFSYYEWKILDSRVDVENGYVEATTTSFSSFGLFESTKPTAVDAAEPGIFSLVQNSPNPFNPATTIKFSIPSSGHVTLTVYNMSGQVVSRLVDGNLPAGTHHVIFDGAGLASGVYFYRIVAGNTTAVKRMLLIK